MKRIGIFSGTFDPVHKGHIEFSMVAAQQCELEKVYLLPERHPRGKHDVTDFAKRVALLKQATDDSSLLEVLEFADDQFSIRQTLPELQQRFDGAHLTILLGSDVACHSLPHWQHLDTLLSAVDFVVGVRGDSSIEEVEAAMQKITTAGRAFRYTIIPSPHAHVSSSKIRYGR